MVWVDKQFAVAVVVMIFGFAMMQMGQDGDSSSPFLAGLGVGTIAIAAVWIVLRIVSDLKKGKK